EDADRPADGPEVDGVGVAAVVAVEGQAVGPGDVDGEPVGAGGPGGVDRAAVDRGVDVHGGAGRIGHGGADRAGGRHGGGDGGRWGVGGIRAEPPEGVTAPLTVTPWPFAVMATLPPPLLLMPVRFRAGAGDPTPLLTRLTSPPPLLVAMKLPTVLAPPSAVPP